MSRSPSVSTETVLIASTIGVLTILGLYWYQRKRKNAVPTKWEPVGKVKNLFIYPLKSGHRIELETAICTEYGIKMPKSGPSYQFRDRSFLVYKEDDNEFRTARQYTNMIFIKIAPHPTKEDHFTLDAPRMPTLTVRIPSLKTTPQGEITFHKGEKIFTLDCGDKAAKWISNYILGSNSGLRLGFHDTDHRRNICNSHKKYLGVYPRFRNQSIGMYTDFTSYLVINQASVDDLNNRIPETNITALNFRPNILVEGENATPYSEDNWNWVKIGDAILYLAKPCTRCVFTTIDPETGIKSESNEPIKTLKKYRMLKDVKNIELDGSLPVMGNNMGLEKGGVVSVGDVVYVGRN
ncbi:hypothetical protein ILUMI_07063 [Ignelater luminosus]|uniref:MOSC domain-containing protein n=1 Tax=Ignelater luminosus TaxID=2038154 RepID=A0A8K0D4K0_IGNLU|nr:hypothetical protein ILUMI_07063 [Ignelater luminosus]